MSRARNERTLAQLAVLAKAREKAKIVIAERAKLHAQAKKAEPVSDLPPEPVSVSHGPVSEEAPLEPVWEEAPRPPPPDPSSESEDEEPRLPSPKYRFVHGVGYIKIK